jgi:hypothetical protein
MSDGTPPLPAKVRPLDRAALERVLARAAELQAGEGEQEDPGLTDAQLVEIAREVGLEPRNLLQAMAEERSRAGAPAPHGAIDLFFGIASAAATRTVRGLPADALTALDAIMQHEEGLRVKRRFPDRTLWERAPGIVANLSRAFDLAGRGYHLTRADEVGAEAIAIDSGRTLVRVHASLAGARAQNIAAGSFLVAIGAVGSGILLALGLLPLIAAAPVVVLTGGGYFAARNHLRSLSRVQVALEQVLDRLERDERPRPSLLGTLVPSARPR